MSLVVKPSIPITVNEGTVINPPNGTCPELGGACTAISNGQNKTKKDGWLHEMDSECPPGSVRTLSPSSRQVYDELGKLNWNGAGSRFQRPALMLASPATPLSEWYEMAAFPVTPHLVGTGVSIARALTAGFDAPRKKRFALRRGFVYESCHETFPARQQWHLVR